MTPGEVQPAAGLLLVAGMVSSTSAQLVSYPLGLVRTRLQARRTIDPLVRAAPRVSAGVSAPPALRSAADFADGMPSRFHG